MSNLDWLSFSVLAAMVVGAILSAGPALLFLLLAEAPWPVARPLSAAGLLLTLAGSGLFIYSGTHHILLAVSAPAYAFLLATWLSSLFQLRWSP